VQREDFRVSIGRAGGGIFVRILQIEGFVPPRFLYGDRGFRAARARGGAILAADRDRANMTWMAQGEVIYLPHAAIGIGFFAIDEACC
jgi:hypothetical protein